MTTYTYRLLPGHSAIDHLADEIIARAQRHAPARMTKRAADAALRTAVTEMRALMGPQSWPSIVVERQTR